VAAFAAPFGLLERAPERSRQRGLGVAAELGDIGNYLEVNPLAPDSS